MRKLVRFIVVLLIAALMTTGCNGCPGGEKYSVSGRVTDFFGNGIHGVTLCFTGEATGTATTNANGDWAKVGLEGEVTITPVLKDWKFEPSSRKVTGASKNVDFVGLYDEELNEHILRPLTVTPDTVQLGVACQVTFSIILSSEIGAPQRVIIEEVLQDGTSVALDVDLVDNGDPSAGDDIADDRCFNGRCELTSEQPGHLSFRALVEYLENDKLRSFVSNTVKVVSIGDLTEDRAEAVLEQAESIQELFSTGIPAETAAQNALSILQADPSVYGSGLSGSGKGVWWVTEEGIPCAAGLLEEGLKGGETLRPGGHRVRSSPMTWQELVEMTSDPFLLADGFPRGGQGGISVGGCNAIVIRPFAASFGSGDDAAVIEEMLQDYGDGHFAVERFIGTECGIEAFKEISDYGIVVISSHGDTYFGGVLHPNWGSNSPEAQVIILTQERASSKNDLRRHKTDLLAGRLVLHAGAEVFGITPSFIRHYCPAMPDSLVYASACRSAFNATMASAFFDAGAKVYYGYDDYVSVRFAAECGVDLFTRLLSGDSSGTAFTPGLQDPYSVYKAIFMMFGAPNVVFSPPRLLNGSFEQGLKYWIGYGDVRVIGQLGPIIPDDGHLMAIISTGIGAINDSDSLLIQRFTVPYNAAELLLWYDVISEEPLEWIGKGYDDKVEILIGEPHKQPEALVIETVNGSEWFPIDGIDFPGGDDTTYHTGAKYASVSLEPYRGKTVVLAMHCWDEGDSAWDTAAIIDSIQVIYD